MVSARPVPLESATACACCEYIAYTILSGIFLSSIGLHVNADKTEYMCFNQKEDISARNSGSLKLVAKFPYLGSSVWSSENDISMLLTKAWTAIDRLSIIWKSNLSDKTQFFLSRGCVNSTLWMRHIDADWAYKVKTRQELHKNATNFIEQNLEATSPKAAAVKILTSHL